MAARMTKESYEADLKIKFGTSNLQNEFKGPTVPVNHVCSCCGQSFLAAPDTMLYYKSLASCLRCSKKSMAQKKKTPKAEFTSLLLEKVPGIRCKKYVSNHQRASFVCVGCKNTWTAKPDEVLKLGHGCPKCAKAQTARATKYTLLEVRTKLKENNMVVLSKAKNKHDKQIRIKCLCCKHTWGAEVSAATSHGCPFCERIKKELEGKAGGAQFEHDQNLFKTVVLDGNKVTVQGHEDKAIKFLVENVKIKESRIKVFSKGKIQPVLYDFKHFTKEYWPSIQVGKTLVEIYSSKSLNTNLEQNQALAKACMNKGYGFKMLLVHLNKVYTLPKEWLKWKEENVGKFVRGKTLNKVRILSMDPGTTNFAWSVLEVSRPFKVNVIATGMVLNTVKSLTDNIKDSVHLFNAEITSLMQEYQTTHMILERFMSRGMKGLTIELVNVMIGSLFSVLKSNTGTEQQVIKLITAAQWKNEWNRKSDLKAFYEKVECKVHQVDAIGIGLYGAAFWLDEKPFEHIKDLEPVLIRQIKLADLE